MIKLITLYIYLLFICIVSPCNGMELQEENREMTYDNHIKTLASVTSGSVKKSLDEFEGRIKLRSDKGGVSQRGPLEPMAVLSLDGGGYRGLMEAYMLDYLTSVANHPLHEIFDIISGTSIGGILAMASSVPGIDGQPKISTQDMIDLFVKTGHEIFPKRWRYNYPAKIFDSAMNAFSNKYDERPLYNLLGKHFQETRLSDALTHVLVTSVQVKDSVPVLFSSKDPKTNNNLMHNIGKATSAAPSYFPSYTFNFADHWGAQAFTDGGLWCNNPTRAAYDEALYQAELLGYRKPKEELFILSLGTGKMPQQYVQAKKAGWIGAAGAVIETTMSAVSEGTHLGMMRTLSRDNYVRINPKFCDYFELDDIGEESRLSLQDAAESKYEEIEMIVKDGFLRRILETM
jgi:hypothetical protein